jgi:NAD(P)-dependent dehydrogenase (short-subunit alcohol dehydrogenase family)
VEIMTELDGRVGIVFGGANGIGRAGAEALARKHAAVWIADLDDQAGTALRDELRAAGATANFVKTDILDEDSIAAAYRAVDGEHGRLDVVVNSAGLIAHDVDDAFVRNIDMLLVSVYRSMRCAVDYLGQGGSIINISSIAGITGSIGAPGYGPAKHGVVGLTKDYALSVAKEGIRVNVICPGYVETQQTRRFAPDAESSDRLINETLRVPMRRWGRPEEIGAVIGFLASDEASFMTGSVVVVDGGLTAR